MVVDTSAITAILGGEPEESRFLDALLSGGTRLMSALTALEAAMVIEGRYGRDAGADLDLLVYAAGIEVVPFDRGQAETARLAWRRFGKGNHPAALNLGDCCVYALAKTKGEPVLSKGNDFRRTDLAVVPLDEENPEAAS